MFFEKVSPAVWWVDGQRRIVSVLLAGESNSKCRSPSRASHKFLKAANSQRQEAADAAQSKKTTHGPLFVEWIPSHKNKVPSIRSLDKSYKLNDKK